MGKLTCSKPVVAVPCSPTTFGGRHFWGGMTKEEAKEHGVSEQDRGQFVRFGIPKRNYGAPMPDVWLRRGEGGVLVDADLTDRKQIKNKPPVRVKPVAERQEW